jgi:hypothetical protein
MKRKKTINEMGLGMGAVAGGPMGEDDLDMGPPGMDDDPMDGMGMDDDPMGGMGEEGEEESECVECGKDELRSLLDEVEMGEKSAEEAFDQLCSADMDDMDMDDEGLEDALGMDDDPMDPMGAMAGSGDDHGMGGLGECMESVQRIANLITEDPDILN